MASKGNRKDDRDDRDRDKGTPAKEAAPRQQTTYHYRGSAGTTSGRPQNSRGTYYRSSWPSTSYRSPPPRRRRKRSSSSSSSSSSSERKAKKKAKQDFARAVAEVQRGLLRRHVRAIWYGGVYNGRVLEVSEYVETMPLLWDDEPSQSVLTLDSLAEAVL